MSKRSKNSSSKAHSSVANAQRVRFARAQRVTISRRNRTPLSLFRQLTHSPELRDFHEKRILRKREAPQGVFSPFTNFLHRAILDIDEYPRRVCRARKERRQVLFALGKQGGNHKPPRHNLDSKVRC